MNEVWKHMDLTFSRTEAWLTLVGSKTLDSDLGIFIPNQGLHNATTDKFAMVKQKFTQMKTQRTKLSIRTYQVATSRGNPCKQVLS